tara:strand:+ start:10456 stop:10659 length:204 start_codon:yes stop_codon:yes gene_type:complete
MYSFPQRFIIVMFDLEQVVGCLFFVGVHFAINGMVADNNRAEGKGIFAHENQTYCEQHLVLDTRQTG